MKTSHAHKILVASGPNLDLLGSREPEHYGNKTLAAIHRELKEQLPVFCRKLGFKGVDLECFQSNHEGIFLDKLSRGYAGFLLNPGAWTHTSLALADRLAALQIPFIEVHLSNLSGREKIRRQSYVTPLASGIVSGMREHSYSVGLYALLKILKSKN